MTIKSITMTFCLFIVWVNLFTHSIEGRLVKEETFGIPLARTADIKSGDNKSNKRTVACAMIFNRNCLDLEVNDTSSDGHGVEFNDDEVFVLQEHLDAVLATYPRLFSARYQRAQSKYYEEMDDQTVAFLNCNGNEAETANVFADIMNDDELCVDYIDYAPIFKTKQNVGPQNCGVVDDELPQQLYGLDLMTSLNPDNTYTTLTPDNTRNVDLYILDGGIDHEHDEFTFNRVFKHTFVGGATTDDDGHGTHVAGIAGGALSGISKAFDIHSYEVCDSEGCDYDIILMALRNITGRLRLQNQNGWSRRAVINLSLGGPRSDFWLENFENIFDEIIELGGIIVVAAGNENVDSCETLPAAAHNAITVGSFNQYRRKADNSNYGECTDIWAPGVEILSAHLFGIYQVLSGTSMASPYIAGMITNILAVNNDLELPTIKEILKDDSAVIIGGPCNSTVDCFGAVYKCDAVWSNDNTQWRPPRNADPSVYEIPRDIVIDEDDAIIVGVVIGALCICCCCIAIAVYLMRKNKRQNSEQSVVGRSENIV